MVNTSVTRWKIENDISVSISSTLVTNICNKNENVPFHTSSLTIIAKKAVPPIRPTTSVVRVLA